MKNRRIAKEWIRNTILRLRLGTLSCPAGTRVGVIGLTAANLITLNRELEDVYDMVLDLSQIFPETTVAQLLHMELHSSPKFDIQGTRSGRIQSKVPNLTLPPRSMSHNDEHI